MQTMMLAEQQIGQLAQDGYVQLPGIVPGELVDAALRAINGSIGSRGVDPEQLPIFRAQSYCPELQAVPAITDLLHRSPLWSVAESLIGAGKLRPVSSGQIALRFPTEGAPAEPHPHIDGMHTPTNGVPAGEIRNFTALIGVLLSDLPRPYAGNFTTWPGTHRLYERYFRERGPQSLLEGMPPIELPAPRQVTGRAGDAVVCHYQLGHGIAGNSAPHIRYAAFFRLTHVEHDQHKWECMTDIWREWEGMRGFV